MSHGVEQYKPWLGGKGRVIGKRVMPPLALVIFLFFSFPMGAVHGNEAVFGSAGQSSPYVEPRTYRMMYNLTFVNVNAGVDSVEIWMPLPVVWDSQKDVTLEKTDPQVANQSKESQYGNGILYWNLGAVGRGSSKTVMMQIVFTAYDISYQIDPATVGTYDKASPEYKQYTKSEDYVEAAYAPIVQKAKQLVGNETNPYLEARLIYNWVLQHMSYRLVYALKGAKFAYDNGYGECGDYSALFAALSRAVGIPVRLVVGLFWNTLGVYPHGSDRGIHVWAEFLLPGYSWVPADASLGDGSARPSDYFASHPDSNHFLIMSKGTNIQLASGFVLGVFQTGGYWYHGYTGTVDLPYKYSIAAAQIATTQRTSQVLTSVSASQVITTVTVIPEATTTSTFKNTTVPAIERPQSAPSEVLSFAAIALALIVVAGLLYLRKRRAS